MMNNLPKLTWLKKEPLNAADYFQSILQEAASRKLLTVSELESIQLQCLQLLTTETERYTSGASSSVKVETAQNILQSIIYTIGIYLKSLPDADPCVTALKQRSLAELHRQGKLLIRGQLANARQLLEKVRDSQISIDNHAYNDTLQQGLPLFFTAYDVDFAAHETPGSIDYPLSSDRPDLVGSEYILNYLQTLLGENQFCKNFSESEINCLLRSYHEHYQDLLINLYELVLTNLAGSVLAAKKPPQLNIEPLERLSLQQQLLNYSKDQLYLLLQKVSVQICREFHISDQLQQKHLMEMMPNLAVRFKNALEKKQLETLFISFTANPVPPDWHFEDGPSMNDELFRVITAEIRDCRFAADKIAIIQSEVHSITDLADILEGTCIFDSEFNEVFRSLGDPELALLSMRIPPPLIDSDFHFTANEKEWHNRLTDFLAEIDVARKKRIQELTEKLAP
jgi:hypothetical protein